VSRGWPLDPRLRLEAGGIGADDAARQTQTAREILRRFRTYPGQILADEVGMGKTFVALAVASSAARVASQPAVVMVPPRLMPKWERDIRRFRRRCLADDAPEEERLRYRTAERGVDFLRCFDDPPDRRAHLVLLSNTAIHKADWDPFVRLEVLRRARNKIGRDEPLGRAIARWADRLLSGTGIRRIDSEAVQELLDHQPRSWKRILESYDHEIDDDPVPWAFFEATKRRHVRKAIKALEVVPLRKSKHFDDYIESAREHLYKVLKEIWRDVFRHACIRSPLLVFDEAHHLKNPSTRLASLFQDPQTGDTSVISNAFDRMLFLTATPFQLGHRELLQVLHRFDAVHWASLPGRRQQTAIQRELAQLEEALDAAQAEAVALDKEWGRLAPEDLGVESAAELSPGWWAAKRAEADVPAGLRHTFEQYDRAHAALRAAEKHLQPWVIRHLRSRTLESETGHVARRDILPGRSIRTGRDEGRGLEIEGEARFPFLLSARAQTILTRQRERRAYFAEGLASSFGAFRDTSRDKRPVDDTEAHLDGAADHGEIRWYLDAVEEFVDGKRLRHPKVDATAARAVRHWIEGDKVLIFCHYRMTVRDVRDAVGVAVEAAVGELAAKALGMGVEEADEARDRVRRIVGRIQDRESPLRRDIEATLARWAAARDELDAAQQEKVVALLLRTLATPSFVVRNFPLDREEVRVSLEADRPTAAQAREAAAAVAESLQRRRGARLAYHGRVEAFLRHLVEEHEDPEERERILDELLAAATDPVRMAHGEVDPKTRERVLLGFNSPLLPEILIASEVMAEGLDLHLDCRNVIHHDLSWNPSTLEQRTGRIDRLRCCAELERSPIQVYLPYLEGTADEKMYRVVTDRARWFQVVMGEKYEVDEFTTERLAGRVPFPLEAAEGLAFDLSVAFRAEDVPGPEASWGEIQRFALAFDGYAALGSERCAAVANARNPQNLEELRACLFFEQRRWHHFGESPRGADLAYIRSLVDRVRDAVASRGA
jgi:superfamily II DNA or RNA helicase